MIKILFSLALSLALFNCGPTESEPEDVEVDKLDPISPISVWDTLEVIFKNEIKKSDVRIDTVSGKFKWEISGENSLRIFGAEKSYGSNHFPIGESVAFKIFDNRDEDNPIELETVTLDIHPWLDADYFDKNFPQADSLMKAEGASKWVNGQSLKEDFITNGAIIGSRGGNLYDLEDFKLVVMGPDDSLDFSLKCDPSLVLNLQVIGPFPIPGFEDHFEGVLDSAENNNDFILYTGDSDNKGTLSGQVIIKYGNHAKLIDNDEAGTSGDDPGFYVLHISGGSVGDVGFYSLSTSLKKF